MNRKDAKTQRQEGQKLKDKEQYYFRFSLFSYYFSKIFASLRLCGLILLFCLISFAQNKYENRKISQVSIVFEGRDKDVSAADQFRLIAVGALGEKYSAVKVR